MKKLSYIVWLAGLILALVSSQSVAEEKLERGKDRIDVPAIGEGLCLHNLFQSGMVLQREKPIYIWGWAEPGEKVTITFGENTKTCTAGADRSWKIELPALPASSEPRTLVVQGKNKTIKLENILIGDVWLLGGQSNMEFPISNADDGALEIVSANFKNIRFLKVPHLNGPDYKKSFPCIYLWSDWSKRHFRQGFWDVCSPETVKDVSAIGYIFARRIHMATQIPIGVIDTSRGGTCIETWLPLDVLKTIDTPEVKSMLAEWDKKVAEYDPHKDLEERIKKYNERLENMKKQGREKEIPKDSAPPSDLRPGPAYDMNRPGNCYASMIAPIAGFQIKGILWHQGYNNALVPNGHVMYYQVFPKLIEVWRKTFNDTNLPFGIISLCTDGEPQDWDNYLEKMNDEGIYIREVHYKTFLDFWKAGDKNIGYAASFDQRRAWYHPQIKIPVGERIAKWALATQYGKNNIRWLPPMIQEVKIEGDKILLKFEPHEVRPYNDGPILGFAIAGKDGKFQPAKAEWVDKDRHSIIALSSPFVPQPVYFRHAWGRNPLANLKADGIPLDTVRNDNFSIADMYEIYTGKKSATPNVLNRAESRELTKALMAEDLKRRLKESEMFIRDYQNKDANKNSQN